MRCGNCGQEGHNRRTCTGGEREAGPEGYYRRGGGGGGGMQPRRQPAAQTQPVSTLFSCPGGRNGHTLYILVSSSGIAAIVPRRSNVCRGGGARTYYCPTHGCRITRA